METRRYRVRPMRPQDIPAVEAIDRLSFRLPWPPGAFARELNNGQSVLWVAETVGEEDAAEVVGMLVLWPVLDEAHIATVAVHPYHRRRGVGKMLLATAVEFARSRHFKTVTLEVRASNRRAQNLYRRFGFQIVGRRYGYYNDNHEDALIMTLEIQALPREVKREP
ncbi:MAG TPA: ribosomal protein S18-alanine N-acetyltransferase [Anaerolineae bacterium]|nr:ribosomal protein S18-alanine N-acetyltransferase [Anaerolineae bacterium]